MKDERKLTIRIPQKELDLLESYCEQVSRTKTDVLREFIRGLSKKVRKSEAVGVFSSRRSAKAVPVESELPNPKGE